MIIHLILLPTLVSSVSRPTIHYNHTSISGDCAMFETNSATGYVEVSSSSMVNTDKQTIEIISFSGNGHRQLRRPSVNSSTVYDSLFNEDSFLSIFSADNVVAKFTVTRANLRKIELIVRDAGKPFKLINAKLNYYWGGDKLPRMSFKGDRCSALISDFPHVAPFSFISAAGKRLTHFAWLCPVGRVCCAWECCQKFDPTLSTGEIILLSLIITIILCAVIAGCCLICIGIISAVSEKAKKDAIANKNKQILQQYKAFPKTKDSITLSINEEYFIRN